MAIQTKLDAGDIALLEILEDEVWFGEFLRSTGYGETNKSLWPPIPFEYRDYQRQLLTDKNTYISLIGGRAIGKCQPGDSRIYTTQGYQPLHALAKKKYATVYALSHDGFLEKRRAIVQKDKRSSAFTIITQTGHKVIATANHPILTPAGYVPVSELNIGDQIAVATHLPHDSNNTDLLWHELRYIGYILLNKRFRVGDSIKPRFRKAAAELEVIASRFRLNWHKDYDGNYTFIRKLGPFQHPITALLNQLTLLRASVNGATFIPQVIKNESLENIAIFLEALFSQFATLSKNAVSIQAPTLHMAQDIQELLLRFSIESSIDNTNLITLLDDVAIYRFWSTFNLPGVSISELKPPSKKDQPFLFMRYDPIVKLYQSHNDTWTYAVSVYDHNNYIGDNVFVHNTILLEDKIIFDVVNSDIQMPQTPELLLTTANQAQMTPLLNKLIIRFTSSPLLKSFLRNRINKSDGTMQFPIRNPPVILHFRIAGSKSENNVV